MSKLLGLTLFFLVLSTTQQALKVQNEASALKISAPALSGLLVSFFAFIILVCGVYPLLKVQTPVQFARLPLNIGKES